MPSRRTSHAAGLTWLVAIALLAAACGTGSASASPAAQTTASPSAGAGTAGGSGSPNASSSAAGDPIADLSIAPPYTLDALDAGQQAQIEQVRNGLGAAASVVQVGARMVRKSGSSAGLLLAMAFPGVPLNSASLLDSIVGGAAGSAGGTMTTRTILGQEVRLVEGTTTSVAGYPHDGTIVLAYGRSLSEAVEIITAVIQATE
jgi:hypothetical protein